MGISVGVMCSGMGLCISVGISVGVGDAGFSGGSSFGFDRFRSVC